MTADRHIDRFCNGLFENGLEGYDPNARATGTKGVTNAGGAKVFFHPRWKTDGKIQILNTNLRNVLNELPAVLYTLNRIQLDSNKKPVMTKDGTGYNRTHTGLMLYAQFDDAPDAGERIRDRIVEAVKEVDLRNYIEVASKINDANGVLNILETLKHQDFNRNLVPLKLSACVFVGLPSGPTTGFWNFQNVRVASRSAMSAASSASVAELDNIPI